MASAFSDEEARRPVDGSDVVDGVSPAAVIEAPSTDALAATLARASRSGLTVVLRGSGTRDSWGRTPRPFDVLLRTHRLNRVIAHEDGDLTATVEAGARLSDVNRILAHRGQRLPLDALHAASTIGGLLATNDTGPLRHRFGTPRDLVLGMTVALADGTVARSGGRVVKNVAGYDVGRLIAGSHGSLAAILTATFKLSPLPAASCTVGVTLRHAGDVVAIVDALRVHQHEPECLDLRVSTGAAAGDSPTFVLLVRYASVRAAVEEAVASTCALVAARSFPADVARGDAEARVWADHDANIRDAGTVVRLSWKPADFAASWDELQRAAGDTPVTLAGRAAVGSGLLSIGGTPAGQEQLILLLRSSARFQHVVIVRSPVALRRTVDVWPMSDAQRTIWQRLKAACDPGGTLNAGRGPL
jgi:glycolate oxidase FAD binding subunit